MTLVEAARLRKGDRVIHCNHRGVWVVEHDPPYTPSNQSVGCVNVLISRHGDLNDCWEAWSHLLTLDNPYAELEIGPDFDQIEHREAE